MHKDHRYDGAHEHNERVQKVGASCNKLTEADIKNIELIYNTLH